MNCIECGREIEFNPLNHLTLNSIGGREIAVFSCRHCGRIHYPAGEGVFLCSGRPLFLLGSGYKARNKDGSYGSPIEL